MYPAVRPRNVALFGGACLVCAILLGVLQMAEPLFWVLYATGLFAVGASYLYLAVSLIDTGRKWIGWALVWVPALIVTVNGSPDIGVVAAIAVASIVAAILVGVGMLALRVGRRVAGRATAAHP